MRRALIVISCAALPLAACGSSSGKDAVSTDTSTSAASSTTAAGPTTTSTTVELPTTSLPCQPVPVPATPVASPVPTAQSAYLTNVQDQSDGCVDHVIFDYIGKGADPVGYSLTYGVAPFVATGSAAPVAVAGTAFVVVTVKPGYGFDFETGKASYTGPKSITLGHTNHVKAIVETGDFEGTLTWVIGLDAKRPFSVQATGTPRHQLVVTIS